VKFISVEEFLMNRAKMSDLPDDIVRNLNTIVPKANELLEKFGEYRAVTSGYRRPEDNARVAVPKMRSAHLTCEAVDLEDKDGRLKAFVTPELLTELDLYMEDGAYTPSWLHVQTRPPKSKKRVFIP
jgi:hypothetical protein